ncbi:MAG: glycosyltransferase [Sphingobacteriales bacterium]|nr:glycosyltransferase [Sphingobacteriales bacterium]
MNILYISYDGMTDPLGQSQVLPYIIGIQQQLACTFTLLSCEKPDRFAQQGNAIQQLMDTNGIDWQPLLFHTKPPFVAKLYDQYQLKRRALQLHRQKQFAWVHCRSYVAAMVGEEMKQKTGIKMLFDMRGFWVDERVEGGMWNLKNPFYQLAYQYYKHREAKLINIADAIVVLTQRAKTEIETWASWQAQKAPITVIPCSADFDHFTIPTSAQKQTACQALQIPTNSLVISYLGSIGTWYMLNEMLDFFFQIKQTFSNAILLFITPDSPNLLLPQIAAHNISPESVRIVSATRQQVPYYMAASDVNLFFIRNSYAKQASSPVKLGEVLAMGIPIITNSGVGDVDTIVQNTHAGMVLNACTIANYQQTTQKLPDLLHKNKNEIRQKAAEYYLLSKAVTKYAAIYAEKK